MYVFDILSQINITGHAWNKVCLVFFYLQPKSLKEFSKYLSHITDIIKQFLQQMFPPFQHEMEQKKIVKDSRVKLVDFDQKTKM